LNYDPFLFYVTYLYGRIRQRTRAALDVNPESGALSLEWIVIAAFVVLIAGVAYTLLKGLISTWGGEIKTGP
jgi:hypothetical protein